LSAHQYTIGELGITPVDQNSSIPFYQQVRIELLSMLQSEKLKPGDMLPAEKDLAQAYRVSRQTIRQAIGLLASEHLLERTPGRGTTVRIGRNRLKFFLDRSFTQQMHEIGLKAHSEVLRITQTSVDDTAPSSLYKKIGSPALDLIRIRYGNNSPIGIQHTTVITDMCPDLYTHDFSNESLYTLLLKVYKLPISRIDQVVDAVVADGWHKNLLKMSGEAALLKVKTTAYTENGEPIEATTSFYRADKYEFSISQNYD
jgi:GntR family transcriptional regulator